MSIPKLMATFRADSGSRLRSKTLPRGPSDGGDPVRQHGLQGQVFAITHQLLRSSAITAFLDTPACFKISELRSHSWSNNDASSVLVRRKLECAKDTSESFVSVVDGNLLTVQLHRQLDGNR
jgi:hypothetical protein